ncbi:hypothetical protein HZS_448 [Henneguya salminicola]|nr:hypothetical protein HZS_448 [Henneguya salminicola]
MSGEIIDVAESLSHKKLIQELEPIVGKIQSKSTKKPKTIREIEATKLFKNSSNLNFSRFEIKKLISMKLSKNKIKKTLRPIDVPKPPVQTERKEKKQNYSRIKKEMNDWQHIIEENRNLKIMKFPLNEPDISEPSLVDWIKVETDEEPNVTYSNIKDDSLMRLISELSPSQRNILNKLHFEENIARRKHLRQIYSFLNEYGKARNRVKKIKSKSYHKNLKKRERKDLKDINIEDMKSSQPELYENQINELEKLRAEERARLKHRGGSKWRRNLLLKGSRNPELTEALIEQHRINQKLTVDNKIEIECDEDEIESKEVNVDGKIIDLVENSWFNENSTEIKLLREALSSQFAKPSKINSYKRKINEKYPETNLKLEINSISDVNNVKKHIELFGSVHAEHDMNKADKELIEEWEPSHSNTGFFNDVADAFKDDNAIEEFIEDNKPIDQEEKLSSLPGWGRWTNPSLLNKPKPIQRESKNHLNFENPHVIFNIPDNPAINKHLVKFVPRQNINDFQKSVSNPLGPEWNSATKFKKDIQPKIQTTPGDAITALDPSTKSNPDAEKLRKLAAVLPLKIREALLSKL